MELDLVCLASFLILVEERHYGRAARALHVTPSALTKRVQRLEQQLGVSLIERGPTGVIALTGDGQQLAPQAASLMAHARSVQRMLRTRDRRHVVRLGLPGVLGDYPSRTNLARIRRLLSETHPTLELKFRGIPYTEELGALSGGYVDVMVTAGQINAPMVESIEVASMIRLGMVPFRHELAEAPSIAVERFCDLPLIRHPAAPDYLLRVFCLGDIRPLREAHLVGADCDWSLTGIQEYALRTGAVGVCPPDFMSQSDPRMRFVTLDGAPRESTRAVIRLNDRRETTLALINAIRRALTERVGAS